MKRVILLLVSVLTVLLLVSCGAESKDMDVVSEAKAIINQYSFQGKQYFSDGSGEGLLDKELVLSYYGDATGAPDFEQVEAYGVYIDESKPLKPAEFGIFKLKDGADAQAFTAYLRARVEGKVQNAVAYPDMNVEGYKTAVYTVKGNYVWYSAIDGMNADIDSLLGGKL